MSRHRRWHRAREREHERWQREACEPGHEPHHTHHTMGPPPPPGMAHGPGHLRPRWRHYFGAHLHRRIFAWFGVTIVVTGLVASGIFRVVGGPGHRAGLAALFGAWFVLWMAAGKIARHIARPLRELLHVTQEIGAGRLSARARLWNWRSVGEIALLARAINDMATRIERQIGDQRELLAGVSHEIRTPLARIRVLIDLGRQRAGGGEGAGTSAAARTLDEIESEVLEIDALVGELLASARLDFAAITPRSLDAREVGARALERAGAPAEALAVEGGDGARGDLRFDADPTLLARALANLLDNARRHAGGVDRLLVRAEPARVSFEVLDHGPGFPAAGAPAGERERPEGSLGLGLVLVRRIADAHRGTLTVGNRPDGGASARLDLPRTAPAAAVATGPAPAG